MNVETKHQCFNCKIELEDKRKLMMWSHQCQKCKDRYHDHYGKLIRVKDIEEGFLGEQNE